MSDKDVEGAGKEQEVGVVGKRRLRDMGWGACVNVLAASLNSWRGCPKEEGELQFTLMQRPGQGAAG